MSPWIIGLLVFAAVVLIVINTPLGSKLGLPGAGKLSLDGAAIKLAALVKKVKGDVVLSYAGRQAIRTIMLFVMVCLETLPDGDVKDQCKDGAKKIDAAFFDPPQVVQQKVETPAAPKAGDATPGSNVVSIS